MPDEVVRLPLCGEGLGGLRELISHTDAIKSVGERHKTVYTNITRALS
jgi:hypothetical protein